MYGRGHFSLGFLLACWTYTRVKSIAIVDGERIVLGHEYRDNAKLKSGCWNALDERLDALDQMAKNLVIVESPAKAKTINKYLGKDYLVKASIGHIKDLPSKGLGVDVDDDFKPTYEVIPDSKKRNNKRIVAELKAAAKEADTIYFAADPDREGEAICQHLAEEIVPKRPAKATFRVMFNEITKRAVNEAFEHPKQIDQNLVDSQQARRVLDRLVGYKVSPLLCRTVGGKLSAGRVQSVALRMVVERERDIEKFVKTEYWTILANLGAKLPPAFDARLFKVGEQTVKTGGFDQDIKRGEILINDEAKAAELVAEANQQTFVVSEVTRKERKRNPVPPFITSKLQQEAARKLGFAVRRTMMVAQKLYEGIEIGAEGSVGLITYMRTDSTRVSDAAFSEVRDFISKQYGAPYSAGKGNSLSIEEGRAGCPRGDSSYRCRAYARLARKLFEQRRAAALSLDLAAFGCFADDARRL